MLQGQTCSTASLGGNLEAWICGNTNKLGDAGRSPRKSSLFFLTRFYEYPGIRLSGDRVQNSEKHHSSGDVWCALDSP